MRTITVAAVLPADSRPGETVSGRLVTNPEDVKGIRGLKVVPAKVRVPRALRGRAVLEGLVVDTGNGTEIPATDGFAVRVPALGAPIPVSVEIAGEPQEKTDIPVSFERAPIPSPTPRRSENTMFTALPIVSESGFIAVHGPFGGDSKTTRITVNNRPAQVVVESPREIFIQPDNLEEKNHLVIQEGANAAAFDVIAPAITISSPRTTLSKGDASTFDVRVALNLPESAWKAGNPAELYDIAQVRSEAPELAPPSAGEAGYLLLIIKNDTPEIVSMAGAHGDFVVLILRSSNFVNGEYHYRGNLLALLTGTFAIEVSIVPFLDEIPGTREELRTGEPVSNATPTPKPRAEDEESREDPNAENYGDDEPSEEELIREAEFEHVLEIFSADLKAARQALDKYERCKEYNDAFNATESIEKARAAGHPLTSEQIDKIWKDWGDARHKWDDLRDKFGKARRAAEDAYFKLPAGALKAIEHPLSFTPTFSGLPDADKLRQAYDYKLKEAEERLKEQREERESRESN